MTLGIILRSQTSDDARFKRRCIIILVIIYNVAEITFLIMARYFVNDLEEKWVVRIDQACTNTILLLVYAYVILHLMSNLNKLQLNNNNFAK